MAEDVKVDEATKPVEEKPVVKIDERAVRLAQQVEESVTASAQAEADIAQSEDMRLYVKAGLKHLDTVKTKKAALEYHCEFKGVASSWLAAHYDDALNSIVTRTRATSPESFANFDSLKESAPNGKEDRRRIQERILVAMLADALIAVIGELVWKLSYRLLKNYLVNDQIFSFSKEKVEGFLQEKHVEFLRSQLTLIANGQSSNASFLNALKAHYAAVAKDEDDKANANLTPEEREKAKKAAAALKKAQDKEKATSELRKGLVDGLGTALSGKIAPAEVQRLFADACANAKVKLPFVAPDVREMTAADLKLFLEAVVSNGGATKEDRRKMVSTIINYGDVLDKQRKAKINAATDANKLKLAEAVT